MKCLLVAALMVAIANAEVKPVDLPCVTWIKSSYSVPTPTPSDLFSAAYTWIVGYTGQRESCLYKGDVFPCFTDQTDNYNWGHHDYSAEYAQNDYCRNAVNGQVQYATNFWLPQKGPKYQTWKWHTVKTGDPVPAQAIRYGPSVMARSLTTGPGSCFGDGFTGWAEGQQNGTFGKVHFSIAHGAYTTDTFEVAVCEAYHPTTTVAPPTTTTDAPTTLPPTVSPTLPPNNKPYIRFAHTIPSSNTITATITQGSTSHTWSNYEFAQFSDWVEIFKSGVGTITLTSGGSTLLTTSISLTPGPLVVAVKNAWPPVQPSDVETIAASYVPVSSGSGVRLFNLSPDTQSASMSSNGKALVNNVIYSDGSVWASIPSGQGTFTATDFISGATLATDTFSAPPAPFVFTNFLVGLQNTTDSQFKTKLVPLVDAPEF